MYICCCGSAKNYRKPIANLRLRYTSCSFTKFAVAELSVNLRCPALQSISLAGSLCASFFLKNKFNLVIA